jgi:hypothetical protein
MVNVTPSVFYMPPVVTMIGACTDENEPMCIVTEYLPMGSLLGYLKNAKPDQQKIISMGMDIAAGY